MKVATKFFLVLVVLAAAMLAVAVLAVSALDSERKDVARLYRDNLLTTQQVSKLAEDLQSANTIALELLVTPEGPARRALRSELALIVRPAVWRDLAALQTALGTGNTQDRESVAIIASGWRRFVELDETGAFNRTRRGRGHVLVNGALAQRLGAIFDPMTIRAARMGASEVAQAKRSDGRATRTYSDSRTLLILLAVGALSIGLGVVIWLIRNIVPRLREYSRFAGRVARGDLDERLTPRGNDELTDLGAALNDMVDSRQEAIERDRNQTQFVDAMQMTATEKEAHELIKRHIERAVPRSAVTILNRNNSRDRLEPVTPVTDHPALAESLVDAAPRSCLAVRFARPNHHDAASDALIRCDVCGKAADQSTCQPLLVGGEVIGSVLVEHEAPLDAIERETIKASVTQAAPVLANLRTLAVAENRAATDSLTGLPNKRSVETTLKRMVAHAARTEEPLAAIVLDLDHFKQVNDVHGHMKGDEVLAAVGAVIKTSLRESDFAGRYGGEEFLLLLPSTEHSGALAVAEKVRRTIATIKLADLGRDITASLGLAVFPADASDAETLLRHADRALYRAKSNGRNRTEAFAGGVMSASDAEEFDPRTVPSSP
jgi:diguanylate cyclase (GGDEF)-like protein